MSGCRIDVELDAGCDLEALDGGPAGPDHLHPPPPAGGRRGAEEHVVDGEVGDHGVAVEDGERVVPVLGADRAGALGVHQRPWPHAAEIEMLHGTEMIEMGVGEQQRHLPRATRQAFRHQLIDAFDLGLLGTGVDDQDASGRADNIGVRIGDRWLAGDREDFCARRAGDRSPHRNYLNTTGH